MRKTNEQKAITLIALIITIVILLILAAVAISNITNDGILSYAQNIASNYNQAVKNEQDMLEGYLEFLEGSVKIVDKDGNDVRNKIVTSNTEVYDKYGNKIVIPAGFKIRVDNTTNNADTVTEGIVIEDEKGNQFVWIPVGKIYTDTEKTEANTKTITLGRYSDFTATDGVYTPVQTAENYATAATINDHYIEEISSTYENSVARNLGAFITSAITKGGYYIGRYEAGDLEDTLVCKAEQRVYDSVTQPIASSLAQGMYADGYSIGTFSSDLINSYAWDTAIIFIQTFGGTTASDYYNQNNSNEFTTTAGNEDEYCNLNDMAGNANEWSTESYVEEEKEESGVARGGNNSRVTGNAYGESGRRSNAPADYIAGTLSFRVILYVAL